jgi:hypothetical protein
MMRSDGVPAAWLSWAASSPDQSHLLEASQASTTTAIIPAAIKKGFSMSSI